MRRRIAVGVGALGLLTSLMAGTTTETANAYAVYQGSDYTNHNYDGDFAWVCDREADGHGVWMGFYLVGSYDYGTWPVDYSTSENCGYLYATNTVFSNLRTVEDNPDSSTNYYGPWHGYPIAGN